MADLSQNKITIYPGINDISVPPTATRGSNISHVHDAINNLIDIVEQEINDLNNITTNLLQTTADNIQNINIQLTDLSNRVIALESSAPTAPTPTEEEFLFEDININSGIGDIGIISKTGTITKIQIHDYDNAYLDEFSTYFSNSTTNNVFTIDTYNNPVDVDGYSGWEFTFTDVTVTSGDALQVEDTNGNDGIFVTIKVFVL